VIGYLCKILALYVRLHAEGADFPKLDPDRVGVAGGVANIKINLVLLTGIPVEYMTCACHAPFGAMP